MDNRQPSLNGKMHDFVLSDGILMVRECKTALNALRANGIPAVNHEGKPCGVSVIMRPATIEEFEIWKEGKNNGLE